MKKPRLCLIPVVLLVAFALLSLACGNVRQAAQRQQNSNDLKQIALAYIIYCDHHPGGPGPTNPDQIIDDQPDTSAVMKKVKNGEYTVIWGVNLMDLKPFEKNGKSVTIIAYEPKAATESGLVAMCDGAVQQMTAAEFKAAPQAVPSQPSHK